jgi:nitrite reductase (NO-forming)
VELTNKDESGMLHNLDFHSVFGPGGGAPLLTVGAGETKHAWFKLLHPGRFLPRTPPTATNTSNSGLFIYHCAVDPVGMHIANGMYGMVLVEPAEGLPPVDKEFFVVRPVPTTCREYVGAAFCLLAESLSPGSAPERILHRAIA